MKKRLYSALLVLAMLLTLIPTNTVFAETVAFGDFWNISADGTLTILQNASETYRRAEDVPWQKYQNDIKNIVISNNVTVIPEYICSENKNIKKVIIPDSVKTVGEYAFYDCSNLKYVIMGTGIERFDDCCFRGTKLSDVSLPDSTQYIGTYSFGWVPITELNIPKKVSVISNEAFYGCDKLETIRIWAENPYIGSEAFGYYGNVKKVYLPKSMTSSGNIYYGFSVKEFYYDDSAITYSGADYITGKAFGENLISHYNYGNTNIQSISIAEESISLKVGEKYALSMSVKPQLADMKPIYWSTTDKSIAYVDSYGIVHAEMPGDAYIMVQNDDGSVMDYCMVHIDERIAVESITLEQSKVNVTEGAAAHLSANVMPENATDKSLVWSSADENVATVDDNGDVTGISAGTTKIKAESDYDGVFAECEVTVDKLVKITGIKFDSLNKTIKVGEETKLTVKFEPENASNKKLTWSSADTGVVTVNDGTIKGISAGNSLITATSEDGGYKAACVVNVVESYSVSGVTLDKTECSLYAGQQVTVVATVIPSTAINKNVVWSSMNENIATVNNGIITAMNEGSTSIVARTEDGGYEALCNVSVLPTPVSGVKLDKKSINITVGNYEVLHADVLPENAKNKEVIWSIDNSKIATLENGKVIGVSPGYATVTVETVDGGYTDQCNVFVSPVNVSDLKLNKGSITLKEGEKEEIIATIVPSDATNKNIKWSSADNDIAIVENGVVTGVAPGVTVVSAEAEDGNYSAHCIVTVTAANIPVKSVSLSQNTLTIVESYTDVLTATISPSNATNQNIMWSTNNSDVAIVDNGTVTAVSPGTAVIIATTEDGGRIATCIVNVISAMQDSVSKPIASILSGPVKEGANVLLLCGTRGAQIHYTTDGSAPTKDSPLYSEPIQINSAVKIKAIAVKNGMLDSDVASFSYTIADPTVPYVSVQTNLTGNKGDVTTVSVNISENSGSAGGSFNLVYDNSAVELLSVENGTYISKANPIVNDTYAANKVRTVWAGSKALAGGGEILTAQFRILDDTDKDAAYFNLEKLKLADDNAVKMQCLQSDGVLALMTAESAGSDKEFTTESILGDDNKSVSVTVTSNGENTGKMYVAVYDTTNKLIQLKCMDVKNSITPYNIIFDKEVQTGQLIKIFVWDTALKPLSDVEMLQK